MKRWHRAPGQPSESIESPRLDAFLAELVEVSRKHGMSLGHEDGHGNFIVHTRVDEDIYKWLSAASIDRSEAG